MRSKGIGLLLAFTAALAIAPATPAQSGQAQAGEERYVTQKGFYNRVFEIKHRDPQSLARVLTPLGSGFRGAAVSPNAEFKTITVRDFPENIAAIEEALRRLDTPEPPRPGVEFQVHLLVASKEAAVGNDYPAELNDTLGRLRTTLGLKSFNLMGSQVVRSRDGRGDTSNRGVAAMKGAGGDAASIMPVHYNYNLRSVSLEGAPGAARVRIGEFILNMQLRVTPSAQFTEIGFQNPVELREGERVVVGTTSAGDKSIVVVLTAGTIK